MYALLTTSPFRLPTDPGPLAIYNLPPTQIVDNQGAPVLDAAGQPTYVVQPTIGCAEQATINACFSWARNYWLLYMNIRRAVYNILDDNINNAFKLSDDPNLVRWNPAMKLWEWFLIRSWQCMVNLLQQHSFTMIHYLGVVIPPKMHPKYFSVVSKIVKKSKSWEKTHTPHSSS
jgi:hypothetical protein